MSNNQNDFVDGVSSNLARESIRPEFILSGNQNRELIQSITEPTVIYLGEDTGTVNTLAAKTIRFGTNTIHPDGTGTATGFMELPTKWGFNGMYLGITGGRLDWIDPLEIFKNDNNSVFGFANYGTHTVVNNDYANSELGELYDKYRNVLDQSSQGLINEITTRNTILSDISNIRLSSTLGLFSSAKGFASTAIGWENETNNNFTVLIGSNLDLSATRVVNDVCGGEIVLGTSNVKYDDRDLSSIDRILTVGNGDISKNGDANRSDAFFILKNGDSYFKNNLDVCGNVRMHTELKVDNDITTESNVNVKYGVSCETLLTSLNLTSNMASLETITAQKKNQPSYYDNQTGQLRFGTSNGMRINMYEGEPGRNTNKLAIHEDQLYPSSELEKNYIRMENTGGIQIFTTRPNNLQNPDSEISQRNAYGTIQILHPDAYNTSNQSTTGFNEEKLVPPTISRPFRGTQLTWWGISSEDVSFSKASIGGIELPPANHAGDMNTSHPNISDHTGKVLINNGDGTCKWTQVSIDTEADISLSQFKDVFKDTNHFIVMSKEREDLPYDSSGLRVNNSLVDNSQVIMGNLLVHKDVSLNEKLTVGNKVSIYSSVDISDNVDISGSIKILGKSSINNSLDLSGYLFTDGSITAKDKIYGFNGIEISGNADISGNIDVSGTVKIGKETDISGDVNIFGDKTRVEKLIVDQNIYFSDTVSMTKDRLPLKTRSDNSDISGMSILEFVNNQVASAISNTITNPAGSIIWFAREPDNIPINYLVCNGQYVGRESYNALYDAMPNNIKDIANDIVRYPELTIEIHESNIDSYPVYPNVRVGFKGILKHNYYNNYYDIKTKIFSAIANDKIRIDISGSSNRINNVRFTITPMQQAALRKYTKNDFEAQVITDQGGNNTEGTEATDKIITTTVPWSTIQTGITNNGYYEINSSYAGLDTTIYRFFKLHIEVDDTQNSANFQSIYRTDWGVLPSASSSVVNPVKSETIYSNTYYNKYEEYSAVNRSSLNSTYFKIPNLIDRFVRGGETNIGNYYEDTVKNHTHEVMGHTHNFSITESLPHSHDNTAVFTGYNVAKHNHELVLETIDVSFEKIIEGASNTTNPSQNLGKLLVHPQSNDPGNKYLGASAINVPTTNYPKGSNIITPTGAVSITPATNNLVISLNNTKSGQAIDNSFEDISGILDVNRNTIPEKEETRPKHIIMLPCIAIGTNNIQSSSSNLENYSVESRVNILENRVNNFDICMNSARINIHRFTENPSGRGLEAS